MISALKKGLLREVLASALSSALDFQQKNNEYSRASFYQLTFFLNCSRSGFRVQVNPLQGFSCGLIFVNGRGGVISLI